MSVSIAQKIHAYAVVGRPGIITVEVTVTNNGNQPIFGSARGLGFLLYDQKGHPVSGFHRNDPNVSDMTSPIQNGGSYTSEIHFMTDPVDMNQQFKMVCIFGQTQDTDEATFSFQPYYLGKSAIPGGGFDKANANT